MSGCGIFNQLDTVIIRVTDLEQASQWYANKLELGEKCINETEDLVVYDLGNVNLVLWQLKSSEEFNPQGMRGTYPIFGTHNAEETRETLVARGVRVTNIYETGNLKIFYFYDPDGNCMEACQTLRLSDDSHCPLNPDY
ncbi:MAG: VOC family protein [Firmicutes bacterium]|nr:VOC family protein [Bacillota bacterium]